MTPEAALTVLKLGGELLEEPARLRGLARAAAAIAAEGPLVVVHGGGREIDAECARRGLGKTAVDGLRVTDADTLDAVVTVLAGVVNTRLVTALVQAGVRAVGLSGVDASCVPVTKAPPHRRATGHEVDLGLVGLPDPAAEPTLVLDLLRLGYVPVLACFGADVTGQLYNVNADILAAHLAVTCGARRLLVAGGTGGVLDADGRVLPEVTAVAVDDLISSGTATVGMVTKLLACRQAARAGVDEVVIVDGRTPASLLAGAGTRVRAEDGVPAEG